MQKYIKFKEFTIKFGKESNCNMDTIDEVLADKASSFIALEKNNKKLI